MQYAVTHNGGFHGDDAMSGAILRSFCPGLEIRRTRDPEVIEKAAIAFDVGMSFDREAMRFDHHMKEGAGYRQDGIPYASAGLIWREFGVSAIEAFLPGVKDADVAFIQARVDRSLIRFIDAVDCGVDIGGPGAFNYSGLIAGFVPTWQENATNEELDKAYEQAVSFSQVVLGNAIAMASALVAANELVRESRVHNGNILILDKGLNWKEVVVCEMPEIKFVIFPDRTGSWRVQVVPEQEEAYKARKDLPAAWAGLEGNALSEASGVEGSIFCHRACFIAGNSTLDGAIRLAEVALAS